jgi:hypothetical protein
MVRSVSKNNTPVAGVFGLFDVLRENLDQCPALVASSHFEQQRTTRNVSGRGYFLLPRFPFDLCAFESLVFSVFKRLLTEPRTDYLTYVPYSCAARETFEHHQNWRCDCNFTS